MNQSSASPSGINRTRLFSGICLSLIPTGASFALIASIIPQLKAEFILTNGQVGAIAGAAIWGMAISLLVVGPFLEGLGMKKATWVAFLGHLLGVTVMISAVVFTENPAVGFWVLMLGAVLCAGGNGMIEVAGNPLTAALYPENKAHKLNIFHAFFPLAILVASLVAFLLEKASSDSFLYHWTFRLALIYIPIVLYGILLLPQRFPKTENAEAGLPVKEMFRYTFTHPLMYAFLFSMAVAIGLELGINRWIPPIYNAVGFQGLLMLSWISLIMMVLRFFSGPIIARLSPPGLLALASVFTCLGIWLFGVAGSMFTAFLAATFFGFGVAFFFPTIVGLVAERLPKTGSLGIVLTCGIGLASAGLVGTPGIGAIADRQLSVYLNEEKRVETVTLIKSVTETFPGYLAQADTVEDPFAEFGYVGRDIETALIFSQTALESYIAEGENIVGRDSPQALRAISGAAVSPSREVAEQSRNLLAGESGEEEIVTFVSEGAGHAKVLASDILGPAEGFAGQRSLRLLAWVPLLLTVFFGLLYINDLRRGGYRAVRLEVQK